MVSVVNVKAVIGINSSCPDDTTSNKNCNLQVQSVLTDQTAPSRDMYLEWESITGSISFNFEALSGRNNYIRVKLWYIASENIRGLPSLEFSAPSLPRIEGNADSGDGIYNITSSGRVDDDFTALRITFSQSDFKQFCLIKVNFFTCGEFVPEIVWHGHANGV